MKKPEQPIERHLFYSQEALFPSDTERLRIEFGHRTTNGALLVAVETHEMPSRRLRTFELRGGNLLNPGPQELIQFVGEAIHAWMDHRYAIQQNTDPF